MANTSLGFTLPVTGTLSGTWGDTVNNEITTLIDTAIAGTYAVTVDTDYTLTTTVSATSDSRNAILRFTGARTAVRTVTAPAQSKIYIIQNQTTGGFGVKLVGAGPTTGITILNGEEAVVAWNGTDFVRISTIGGPTEALSMNNGQLAGLRNKVTNGAMTVWQASAGGAVSLGAATSANSAYGIVDRYGVSSSGATTPVVSVVTAAGTGSYAQATTVSYVSGTAGGMGLFQRIEAINCADLVSKTVTFQAELSGATSQTVNWEVYYANTKDTWAVTGGSPTTGATLISSGTFSTTTTPTIYSASFSAGANAGNGLMIVVRTTANTGLTLVTSGWQLEIGSVATAFEHRPYTLELHLCGSLSSTGLGFTRGITVTDNNGGQLAGMRNRFINGGTSIQQRGSVNLSNTSVYTADRWLAAIDAGTGITATGNIGGLAGTPSAFGLYIAGTWTAGRPYWTQKIESYNVKDLVGKAVTVSGYINFPSGINDTLSVRMIYATAADNFTTTTVVGTNLTPTITGTGAAIFFSTTFSAATMNVANIANGIALEFFKTAIVTHGTTVNYVLSSVQLEVGPVATPFEQRPIGMELALCQRYFEVSANMLPVYLTTTTQGKVSGIYQVPKRGGVIPTVSTNPGQNTALVTNTGSFASGLNNNIGTLTLTSYNFPSNSSLGYGFDFANSVASLSGTGYLYMFSSSNVGAYLFSFSAEL